MFLMDKQKLKLVYGSIVIFVIIWIIIWFYLNKNSSPIVDKINNKEKQIKSLVNYDGANLLYLTKNSSKLSQKELNLINYVFDSDNKLNSNFSWGLTKKSIENKSRELGLVLADYNLSLELIDYKTKKEINSWTIYINNINVWEFKDGEFNWSFKWIKWIELFNILVRSNNYSDWFIKLNSLNSASNYLYWTVFLKKTEFTEINLSNWIDFKSNTFSIKWDKCSIVNKDNTCFYWKAKFRYNFISWDEANNYQLSLAEMKATYNWKIATLYSWWMTFIDLLDDDWNYLNVAKDKNIEISYKVSKSDMENMKKFQNAWQLKNDWYWFFDKNSMLWIKKEAEIKLDENNLTWTAKIKEIY